MRTLTHSLLRRRVTILRKNHQEDGDISIAGNNPEGVYERIRIRLLAHPPVPGQLLQIGALADELGVSATPVREALTRLAAERLIASAPRRGFFAKTPSEDELRGLYCVNQSLLNSSLDRWPRRSANDKATVPPKIPAALRASPEHGAEQLVPCTEELFAQIAAHSGIDEMTLIVRNINDRLHHARFVECAVIGDSWAALSKMQRRYEAGKREQLRQALKDYHDGRLHLISLICKELLFRSFTSR